MSIRRTARPFAALSLLALAAVASGASAAGTSLSGLSADYDGTDVVVSGSVAFAPLAGPVTAPAGTDATGDGTLPGGDLSAASIAVDAGVTTATFRLGIANGLPDPVGATPVFLWPVSVDGVDSGYALMGARAGTSLGGVPQQPFLRLTKSTAAGSFSTVATLGGSVTSTAVTWEVPLSSIGAAPGSVISQGSAFQGSVQSVVGVGGVVTLSGPGSDSMTVDDVTLPNRVSVGIVAAGKVAKYTGAATVDSYDGSFEATLPAPKTPGDYTVYVKACSVSTDCTVGSVPVRI